MSAEEPQTDREWLMRIDGKLDDLIKCKNDHETRIRKLEGFYSYVLGAVAIVAFSIPMAWDKIKSVFGGS